MARRRFVPVAEWEDPRQLLGLRGEQIAMAYLTSCGWEIEAHRFRLGKHDLDVVARRGSLVAFVEVKARSSGRFGAGGEAVGRRKRAALARVAEIWRLRFGRASDTYRFDLVEVDLSNQGSDGVEHYADAWRSDGR
jgi:putative endonuclease